MSSKLSYIDSNTRRNHDDWMPGAKIIDSKFCSLPLIEDYIVNIADREDADERVSQAAGQNFDTHISDDYAQAAERAEIDETVRTSNRADYERATKKKSKTHKRTTKYIRDNDHKLNFHKLFLYVLFSGLALLAFGISMIVVATIITSSGLFYTFTQYPALSALVATVPILGGAMFKGGDMLFSTQVGKNRYSAILFVSALVSLLGWVITFSFNFESGGSSDIMSMIEAASAQHSIYYQLWIIFQLSTEILGGAVIALIAQKIYFSKLKVIEAENPDFVGVLEDENEASTKVREADNRIGANKNYRNRVERAREKYINDCLAVLHDYQSVLELKRLEAVQVGKSEIRAKLSSSKQLSLVANQ